jgi:hypothetical protein
MIISHQHKFIFFAIPKTGTHSIRFALRPHLGNEDEEQVGLFHQSKLNTIDFYRRDGHLTVADIKPFISDEIWNSYYKFSFVRNPWDRLISTFFFRNRNLPLQPELIIPYIKKKLEDKDFEASLFYKSQANYLVDENKNLAIDFIGKTETMQADFEKICQKIGIEPTILDQKNQSVHHHYKSYYDDDLKELIASVYKKDIALFNYSF